METMDGYIDGKYAGAPSIDGQLDREVDRPATRGLLIGACQNGKLSMSMDKPPSPMKHITRHSGNRIAAAMALKQSAPHAGKIAGA
ncbi:hypothetical protein CLG96_04110 [Sphingomonas oleivorans]|uniref:Uncharacterized protein n=1 Tax=Sphingomonas oleivorans TaxID=1735121 RepID=A0A2T5G2H6_9SPHN|nr:hypothetical protein CLG96_04110 [Sphingomonas oleivorans]